MTTTRANRGEMVTSASGAVGRYVGERKGLVWVAYREEDYEPMCRAFDMTA